VTEALIPIVSAELKALVAAGVDFVQLDEPSFSCHPDAADHFLNVVARTVRGVHATSACTCASAITAVVPWGTGCTDRSFPTSAGLP